VRLAYLECIQLIERLHRQCLEVVKAELERLAIRDLNNIQALILFNIDQEELTVGELTQRGYYLGSNVSYNVKKMVENGYLEQNRSLHDRRSSHVRLSDKGMAVCRHLSTLFDRHASDLKAAGFEPEDLHTACDSLAQVSRYWASPNHFTGRVTAAA
jgi:DNA-binding MarR family transcriptional regulator